VSIGGGSQSSKSSSTMSRDAFDVSGTYFDPQQQANQGQFQGQFLNQLGQGGFDQSGVIGQGMNYMRNQFQGAQQGLQRFQNQNMPMISQMGQSAQYGANALRAFSQQNNPYLNSQIAQYGQDIGQNLRENILPGIGSGSQLAGQRGSSRQGIAEGMAINSAQQQFGRGAGDMRMQAYGQQQNAANQLAQLGQQGYLQGMQQNLAAQGQYGQNLGQYGTYQQQGFQNLQQNALNPFQIGASVIGDPTALQFGYGQDTARSKSTGRSSGGSASIGFM
jgi:hypothetical protein